jgi:hypothetical protein
MATKKTTETATPKTSKATKAEVNEPTASNVTVKRSKAEVEAAHTRAEAKGHEIEARLASTKPAAKPRAAKQAEAEPKRLSALDAAARVLAETGAPMTCRAMIEAMAAKGYWTSPNGQTPHATLYSAILREIGTKGQAARFVKTDRGRFATR